MVDHSHRGLDWLEEHPGKVTVAVAAVGIFAAATYGFFAGLPAPTLHDEFSYLLAADTFASGRLANPSHPFWQHFETFHVLSQPTYVSKYPLAQGLVLALGQVLTGHPIAGVWLSIGLMVAAMHWMFRAWLPARWALAGALLVLLQLAIPSYWAQSYWGGAVAATGGALLFGATRRIAENPTAGSALALGAGLAILANSRPFEGLIVSLFAAAALAWFFVRGDSTYRRSFSVHVGAPVALILALTGCAMLYYNLRTTGDPLRMPYQAYSDMYSASSFLPWKQPRLDLEFRHDVMREYSLEWGVARIRSYQDPGRAIGHAVTRLARSAFFFAGAFGVLPLLGLPRALRSGWMKLAAGTTLVVWATALFTAAYPHYLAPSVGLFIVLLMEACRAMSSRTTGLRFGALLVAGTAAAEVAYFLISTVNPHLMANRSNEALMAFSERRVEVGAHFEAHPGRDVVFVKYGPGHSFHQEWVYNGADIDGSEIVWARDMGAAGNQGLLAYYADRNAWLLTVSGGPPGAEDRQVEHVVLEPYFEAELDPSTSDEPSPQPE
jgi:hypothetical protein